MDNNDNIQLFESLREVVSPPTMHAIKSFGFSSMTEIQALAIPPLLEGRDLRGTAKTGSGKTLAFLIPAVELLYKLDFRQTEGTGVLILSPTRELAMQIHTVVKQFLTAYNKNTDVGFNWLTCNILTGGTDRSQEAKILKKGTCILIATPGRLLDHIHNTSVFKLQALKCLVLDEADKMLDKHFEEVMQRILNSLPKSRQTMLFSATKLAKSNELVAVALKEDFVEVDASAKKKAVTVDTLKQVYVVCPTEKKFLFLYNIMKSFEKQKKKMMVFFSSCDAVKFYYELLTYLRVEVLCIHGKQEQAQRTKSFTEFTSGSSAMLLCTDVAARGWDVPEVDYILQYDPPHDPSEYIHRVGRTARGQRSGEALLVLRQEELPFVRCLENRRARLTEQVLHVEKLPHEQEKVEGLVEAVPFLKWWAKRAWKSTIHSYTLHKRKDIFNIYNLDIKKLGKSFGLSQPPKVDLAIEYKKSGEKKLLKRIKEGYYDDAYERADKGAGLEEEDQLTLHGDEVANEVEGGEDEYLSKDAQNNGKQKKKKSIKQSADDEGALQETDNNSSNKKNRSKNVSGDKNYLLDETEDGPVKNKKSKRVSIDGNDDLEEIYDDFSKKKFKKVCVGGNDVFDGTDDGSSMKKRSRIVSVGGNDTLEETIDGSNKKTKKSTKRSVNDNVSKETEEKLMKKSKKRKIEENGVSENGLDYQEEERELEVVSKDKKKRKNCASDSNEEKTLISNGDKHSRKRTRCLETNDDSSAATADLCFSERSHKKKHKKNKHADTS